MTLCLFVFFVGNDFLPRLPSLSIKDGAINELLALHKQVLPEIDGYLVNSGDLNYNKIEYFLKNLTEIENNLFKKIAASNKQYQQKLKSTFEYGVKDINLIIPNFIQVDGEVIP